MSELVTIHTADQAWAGVVLAALAATLDEEQLLIERTHDGLLVSQALPATAWPANNGPVVDELHLVGESGPVPLSEIVSGVPYHVVLPDPEPAPDPPRPAGKRKPPTFEGGPFVCDCGREFSRQNGLTRHSRNCTERLQRIVDDAEVDDQADDDPEWWCGRCGAGFARHSAMRIHERDCKGQAS